MADELAEGGSYNGEVQTFAFPAKLFHFSDEQWKQIGKGGTAVLWQKMETLELVRFEFCTRAGQALASHPVGSIQRLESKPGDDKAVTWEVQEEGSQSLKHFSAKFVNQTTAEEFEQIFQKATTISQSGSTTIPISASSRVSLSPASLSPASAPREEFHDGELHMLASTAKLVDQTTTEESEPTSQKAAMMSLGGGTRPVDAADQTTVEEFESTFQKASPISQGCGARHADASISSSSCAPPSAEHLLPGSAQREELRDSEVQTLQVATPISQSGGTKPVEAATMPSSCAPPSPGSAQQEELQNGELQMFAFPAKLFHFSDEQWKQLGKGGDAILWQNTETLDVRFEFFCARAGQALATQPAGSIQGLESKPGAEKAVMWKVQEGGGPSWKYFTAKFVNETTAKEFEQTFHKATTISQGGSTNPASSCASLSPESSSPGSALREDATAVAAAEGVEKGVEPEAAAAPERSQEGTESTAAAAGLCSDEAAAGRHHQIPLPHEDHSNGVVVSASSPQQVLPEEAGSPAPGALKSRKDEVERVMTALVAHWASVLDSKASCLSSSRSSHALSDSKASWPSSTRSSPWQSDGSSVSAGGSNAAYMQQMAQLRKDPQVGSQEVGVLPAGMTVWVQGARQHRVCIRASVIGWISLKTPGGEALVKRCQPPPSKGSSKAAETKEREEEEQEEAEVERPLAAGDWCEVVSLSTVRQKESLQSEVEGMLYIGTKCKVLQQGKHVVEGGRRRLQVDTRLIGWVVPKVVCRPSAMAGRGWLRRAHNSGH